MYHGPENTKRILEFGKDWSKRDIIRVKRPSFNEPY